MKEQRQDRDKNRDNVSRSDFVSRLHLALSTTQADWKVGIKRKGNSPVWLAWQVSFELIMGVAVGSGLGWLLDGGLGTRPLFMFLLLFLGGAVGVINAYRITQGLSERVGIWLAMWHYIERLQKPK